VTEKLLIAVVGFFLTTVCGGVLGHIFQKRSWNNQRKVSRRDHELETAIEIFEEISRLMDKRTYRMKLLFYSVAGRLSGDSTQERLEEYRSVLFEWNDSINRHLALLQIYFGKDVRDEFDYVVGKRFVNVGRDLEDHLPGGIRAGSDMSKLEEDLESLSIHVYGFNLKLLSAIRSK
jgi:hypothetical protein